MSSDCSSFKMAPSPEYDKEPKAPDKSATNISSEDTKLLHNLLNDHHNNSDHKTTNSAANSEVENNKHVESLDDENLRALLNEALNYKSPKDREGKSSLFKELLEEAEQDDQEACEMAARNLTGCRGSNSLQNLVAAALAAGGHHPRHHQPAPSPSTVAARAIHGGSLPSGVDTSSLLCEESSGRTGYLATVRCVNPPPLTERRVSASDANAPHELELLNRRSKSSFPMTYTARATLEIGSGSVCSGRAVTTTTASNQVDAAIPFSCISSAEVAPAAAATAATAAAAATAPAAAPAPASAPAHAHDAPLPSSSVVDPKPLQLGLQYRAVASVTRPPLPSPLPPSPLRPRSVIASSFNGLPLSRPNYGAMASTAADDYKKSLDENGNSVQGYGSPVSGSSQHKKPRRKKSSKNETVIDCRQIDGYQGDKDVNELLRFIESNAESRPKLARAKHDPDDKGGKKRSAERRKDKESKVKRATSLEELSRTKLEDLTAAPSSAATPRPAPPSGKPERRSWGDAAPTAPPAPAPAPAPVPTALPAPDAPLEQADFQTVTKKRKPRRRTEEAPRRARAPSPRRRESAPPSDRSNDSNDDMDSVHSLPEAPRPAPPAAAPAPAALAPHASYAEIARTRHNIPDLIESCNYYTEGEDAAPPPPPPHPLPPPPSDADGYPALETRSADSAAVTPVARRAPLPATVVGRRERKERGVTTLVGVGAGAGAGGEGPAPDVVADRRPPVILLDSAAQARDMDGVTFGFDVNEQLLGGGARRPRCDLVRDACAAEGAGTVPAAASAPGAVSVRAGCIALRFLPPARLPDSHHLHQIIEYVGSAWEEVVRCGGGKVRYFTE